MVPFEAPRDNLIPSLIAVSCSMLAKSIEGRLRKHRLFADAGETERDDQEW
ncbi:hypothetical protein [Stieleria neptunia]|uniref:hypothetical protein n=1 Tax=Stieleria neptunia TaxID=2527979 RepID=UPI0018D1F91E|nr:hypothetical protein [Stieleria neptunia]